MVSYASLRMGVERLQNYYSKFQAVLILFIALQQGFPLWIILLSFVFIPLIMFIDIKYLFPRELSYQTMSNKPLREMYEKVCRIEELLKKEGKP